MGAEVNIEELRVNNYVRSDADGKPIKITKRIMVHLIRDGGYLFISPIPLTEEICRKFLDNDEEWSFEGYGTRLIYRHKKFGSIKVEIGGYDQISLYVNNELLGFKSHLHKIQNIFYALTQTELKIEL